MLSKKNDIRNLIIIFREETSYSIILPDLQQNSFPIIPPNISLKSSNLPSDETVEWNVTSSNNSSDITMSSSSMSHPPFCGVNPEQLGSHSGAIFSCKYQSTILFVVLNLSLLLGAIIFNIQSITRAISNRKATVRDKKAENRKSLRMPNKCETWLFVTLSICSIIFAITTLVPELISLGIIIGSNFTFTSPAENITHGNWPEIFGQELISTIASVMYISLWMILYLIAFIIFEKWLKLYISLW